LNFVASVLKSRPIDFTSTSSRPTYGGAYLPYHFAVISYFPVSSSSHERCSILVMPGPDDLLQAEPRRRRTRTCGGGAAAPSSFVWARDVVIPATSEHGGVPRRAPPGIRRPRGATTGPSELPPVGSGSTNAAPGELLRAAGSGSEDARAPAWTRAPPGTRLTTAVVEVESSLGRRLRPDDGEAKIFFLFFFLCKMFV
jgi:hypothetical protein